MRVTAGPAGLLEAAPPGDVRQYIVVLRSGADPAAVASEHAVRHGAEVGFVYESALRGYAARLPAGRVAALRQDPRVAFVSEDRPVRALVQSVPTGVQRILASASSSAAGDGRGSVGVGVAVLDTGIDVRHPDLYVAGGVNCLGGRRYDDDNGHGTHVAGIIAARDNNRGVVGVAPGAPLYAVRVLDAGGSGSWSSVICGIDWVTRNAASLGIKVANLSLGGVGADDGRCGEGNADALHRAICASVAAGVTYVVAAGNESRDFRDVVPAAYNEVLTVTAIADFDGQPGGRASRGCQPDVDDTAADYSNFTSASSDDATHTIAAPGTCILSTFIRGTYAVLSGTSMAAPHVAGTAALCLAGPCKGLTPAQVITRLRNDAQGQPGTYGFTETPGTMTASANRYYGYLVYAGGY
jgi:subtilisin family serine protease